MVDTDCVTRPVEMRPGAFTTIVATDVRAVAESGVNLISVGWITHSAPTLDVALDFDE